MTAEEIVRALAAMEAPIEVNWPCNCLLCAESSYAPDPKRQALDSHQAGCLWRLAREWVQRPST